VSRVSAEDARIVREIRKFRSDMKRREAKLEAANAAQQNVVADLEAQRRAIEAQLAERQSLLASIESEIERIKAAEEREQARLRAQAEQRLASNPPSNTAAADGSTYSGGAESPGGSAPPPRYGGVVGIAMQYLGVPYSWGGASPSGFDCSGFVMYVFSRIGVSLPHSAAAQYGYGSPVSRSELAAGDLVFFNGLSHVGIYVGGGSFIHSPHTGDVVKISSLYDSWYASTYVGARRI
jgi:peptidoglycan DL-endopeptidase CwlO